MKYMVVALEPPLDEEKADKALREMCTHVYDEYAPRAWFVEYSGTHRELTDELWPDEEPKKHGLAAGYITPVESRRGSGWAVPAMWRWLRRKS